MKKNTYVVTWMCACVHMCMGINLSERSGRSVKTKRQDRVSKPMCLLMRRKALQQSISDYKHGARAYVSMRWKDRRKNRARGEGRRGERRDKAVKVKKTD